MHGLPLARPGVVVEQLAHKSDSCVNRAANFFNARSGETQNRVFLQWARREGKAALWCYGLPAGPIENFRRGIREPRPEKRHGSETVEAGSAASGIERAAGRIEP